MNSQFLAESAHTSLRLGNVDEAHKLFGEAARLEAEAFRAIPDSKPRTKGILAVSAASLWYKSSNVAAAEAFSHEALQSEDLPSFARQELREILQSIWNEHAQQEAAVSFAEGQVIVSVKGGEVVTGGAPLDLILSKVQIVQNLFYRTVEYINNQPLRRKGPPAKEIQDRYRPWIFQSVPGSYQFAVAVQKPDQHDLFPGDLVEPGSLTTKFLEIVQACSESPDEKLPQVVSNPEYRSTFLKMTRSLAPSGKTFSQLEIKGTTQEPFITLSPESRKTISGTLRPKPTEVPKGEFEKLIRGNLRAVDLDGHWLEVLEDDITIKVTGLTDAIDDVIGPMVNHDVIVRARRKGKTFKFIDIEQED